MYFTPAAPPPKKKTKASTALHDALTEFGRYKNNKDLSKQAIHDNGSTSTYSRMK